MTSVWCFFFGRWEPTRAPRGGMDYWKEHKEVKIQNMEDYWFCWYTCWVETEKHSPQASGWDLKVFRIIGLLRLLLEYQWRIRDGIAILAPHSRDGKRLQLMMRLGWEVPVCKHSKTRKMLLVKSALKILRWPSWKWQDQSIWKGKGWEGSWQNTKEHLEAKINEG